MRIAVLTLVVCACSPAASVAPPAATTKPVAEPPKAPVTSCVAPNVDALVAAGKLRRALAALDGWSCPGGEHLAWASRARLVAKLGRVDEARALVAKIDATPWATPEMRRAAREAEKEPAPSKQGVELVAEALAQKDPAKIDRAIDALERSLGAKLTLDPPTRSRFQPRAVAFSAKGDRLALARGAYVDVTAVPSYGLVARLSAAEEPLSLAFSADGATLAVASTARVNLFSLTDGKPQRTLDAGAPIAFAAGSLWARKGDAMVPFDEKTWTAGKPLAAGHPFAHVSVTPDGKRVAFARGAKVEVVDVATGKRSEADLDNGLKECEVASLAFSPDGSALAAGMRWVYTGTIPPILQGDVHYLDGVTAAKLGMANAKREVVGLAFSPDGKQLAGAGSLTTRVWSATRDKNGEIHGRELRKFGSHTDGTLAVAFHPAGRLLVSTSKDETARVWDMETDKDWVKKAKKAGKYGPDEQKQGELFAIDVSESSHVFAHGAAPAWTASLSGAMGLLAIGAGNDAVYTLSFDGKAPQRTAHLVDKPARIVSSAFDASGLLAYGSDDGVVRVLGGKPIVTISRVEQIVSSSKGLFSAITADGTYRSFTTDGTKDTHTPGKYARRALALSPDATRYVARATKGKTLFVIESASGKVTRTLDDVDQPLAAIAVSNDGKLVLAAKGTTVRLHGTDLTLTARSEVQQVAFDAEARLFAVGDRGGFAWFGVDGKQLGRIETADAVGSISFTGDRLVAASADGTVSIVSMKTNKRVLRAGVAPDSGWLQDGEGQTVLFGAAKEASVCRVGALVFPLELCAELLRERVALE